MLRVSDKDLPAVPSDELSTVAVELVRSASRLTRKVGRVAGKSYSSAAWRVLSDLEQHGPTRISDLAAQQHIRQPSMTTLVRRLEDEGWLEREPDPSDGRAILVRLTSAGTDALNDYRRVAAEQIVPILAEFDETDRRTIARAIALMQRLSDLD